MVTNIKVFSLSRDERSVTIFYTLKGSMTQKKLRITAYYRHNASSGVCTLFLIHSTDGLCKSQTYYWFSFRNDLYVDMKIYRVLQISVHKV